jgi:hypothetical protein
MRQSLLIVIPLLFLLNSGLTAQESMYKQALESYQQKDYASAKVGLDAVIANLAAYPDILASDAYYWRGWSLFLLEQKQQAMADFRNAESSPDNGMTAKYMRLFLERSLNPSNEQLLEQHVGELNVMLSRSDLTPSLKDRVLFYRNLLRLQVGESLYRKNQIERSESYFQGILKDEDQIVNRKMNDANTIVSGVALLWLVHEQLSRGEELDSRLVGKIKALTLPTAEDDATEKNQQVIYYQSLLHLFAYLLENDYSYFLEAKNTLLAIESPDDYVADYRATINLLEENYRAVINSSSSGDPFSEYRRGWAHFLRNNRSEKDLQSAERSFRASRDVLPPCQSPLRKASAFRYMQTRHLRDRQTQDFVEQRLSSYFSKECLSDTNYVAEQQKWIDIFEESYGYIKSNCQTGRGNLDIGLYNSVPHLIERGKKHLFDNNCDIVQDDLLRAILLCVGDNPDFPQAIEILSKIISSKSSDYDEAKYALAMAYYNDNQVGNAIPLLDDLAKKGSLDASYKLANIHYDAQDKPMACKMISAVIQQQEVYTIYRADALQLYNLSQCSALGGFSKPKTSGDKLVLRWPEYKVFAYDYIGQGVGIISKLYFEMKSEIVKFIAPQTQIDFYNMDLLVPDDVLTAYINLSIKTSLPQDPNLSISMNGSEIPETALTKSGNLYVYNSGPMDMGDYRILINQKGSFGWLYDNFVSGNFERDISLDSAFVLDRSIEKGIDVRNNISQIEYTDGSVTAFTPHFVAKDGRKHKVRGNVGAVSSVVSVGDEYYCLNAAKSEVHKIKLFPPDSSVSELFIHGVYDPMKDVQEYRDALLEPQKMMKILFNGADDVFYILSSTGKIYEYSRLGYCINVIQSPNPLSFIIDAGYDKSENCLWLLDITENAIHKFEIGSVYNRVEKKEIASDVRPYSIMVEKDYIYVVKINGDIQLYKKSNFRLLNTFLVDGGRDDEIFSNFSIEGNGLDSKRIIAIKRQNDPEKIWPENTVEVFESRFDANFNGAE